MVEHIIVYKGDLWLGTTILGPATKIYVYPGEERWLGQDHMGVVVEKTPGNMDLLFAARDKVVGCEVKSVEDLVRSHRTRRLHRQLRTMFNLVDVVCLVLRGGLDDQLSLEVDRRHYNPALFWGDWVNWQTRGVYLLPVDYENYLSRLEVFRGALQTTGLRALAGTDRHPPHERQPGWLLRRIPGIGPKTSARLIAFYGSPIATFLAAREGAVAVHFGAGIEKKLVDAINEGEERCVFVKCSCASPKVNPVAG